MLVGDPRESTPDVVALTGLVPASLLSSALLLVLAGAAWVRVLRSPMSTDDMAGMSMVMTPTVADGLAYVTAWTVMMAAMMLPSALPMIGLYTAMQRSAKTWVRKATRVTLFTGVYLGLWAATCVPIYLGSVALAALTPNALAYAIAGVLVAAGIFQMSRLKQVCLRHCRSPLGFLLGHWREGWRGSLAMGLAHAVYCLGCCWALMLVLVVAGAMGVAWVLLIAAAVAVEKLFPRGEWMAWVIGAALVLLGAAVALRPELTVALRAGLPSP
jgi:predicted metal-binding membrane protein